jgi:hypothetical protein
MTDTATPAPTSHRRLFIILAVTAIAVIALIAGLFLYASSAAGSKASAYDEDYAAWKAKEKPILLAATAQLPTGTYVTKDFTTSKGLAMQKKGCDAVAVSRRRLRAAADRLPTMGTNGVFGKVSSDYSDAGDTSGRREKAVRAYAKAASATLAQLERDCRWNITFNTSTIKPAKPYEKSSDYVLQPGDREPGGIYCPGPRTCISSIKNKQVTYADLRLEYVALTRSGSLPLYGKKCEATSYGSACQIIEKSFDNFLTTSRHSYDYIRTAKSTTNNPRIHQEFDKIDKARDQYGPQIRKAVLALDPGLKRDKRVRESPSWTDYFFARMAKLQLADLKDERAAIDSL